MIMKITIHMDNEKIKNICWSFIYPETKQKKQREPIGEKNEIITIFIHLEKENAIFFSDNINDIIVKIYIISYIQAKLIF